jgi:hypothetical protein
VSSLAATPIGPNSESACESLLGCWPSLRLPSLPSIEVCQRGETTVGAERLLLVEDHVRARSVATHIRIVESALAPIARRRRR